MLESYLWLVNHLGGVFTLGTFHRKYKQLENTWDDAVSVKRLSASRWCAWAIGHDHRVYIYVRSSDVPIRVPETTFENQRWSPIHGFSKNGLIKTDRPAWSNEAGTVYRPKESVRLPSAHWEWEGDWLIDDNLRGEVVGIEGWQYAFDFPAVYTPEKHWNSFVRKRKWIRFRRFSSTDVWARISDMEVVERTECFIDISVGGFLMPSQPAGFMSVWAVTNNGHVYVRTDVNHDNPEGSTWQELAVADHLGIINISVGISNLVWAVTWGGNTLVRTQVTRNNIYGSGWFEVEHPDDATRFMQISVGKNSVWAVSREGKVWFRKGTSGDDMFWNQKSAIGTSWVEMVGEMSQVSVSSNDQVFAIDLTGKIIYFRTGVTAVDLTGKTWQLVSLHEDLTDHQREGLLSEGDVCSCGDPDVPCGLHIEARLRLSSSATTCSSISTATNVDESSDGFIFPHQPFPIHMTEPFSIPDSASSSWKESETISDSDAYYLQMTNTPTSPTDVSSSCPFLSSAADYKSAVHVGEEKKPELTTSLQQSFSSHTTTPSTSQTFTLSQGSSIENDQPVTETVVFPVAVNTNHKMTESVHEAVLPAGCKSEELMKKLPRADTSSLEYTHTRCESSTNDSHHNKNACVIMKTTCSADCFCESVGKSNSEKYVIVQFGNQDSTEEKEMKKTPSIPFSEVVSGNVSLQKTDSDRLLTEMMDVDHSLPEISNVREENIQHSSKSHAFCEGPTLVSHRSLSDSKLDIVQPDRRPQKSTAGDAFVVESSPSVSKSVEVVAESLEESKMEGPTKETGRLSLEENNSLAATSSISIGDTEPPLKHTSFQKDNERQAVRKKKSKERHPKIIDLSYNDPIIFKTIKTRQKRLGKLVNISNDKVEKTDTISIGSDTSYGQTDETELHTTNEGISIPGDGQHTETDLDFEDGPVRGAYPCYENYSGSSLSADDSNFQSAFPILSSFSGDYLTAVGYNTDSAHTMLTDFDTAQMPTFSPQTLQKKTPDSVLTERLRDSLKPTLAASNRDSSKPIVMAGDRDSPKNVVAVIDRDSPKTVVKVSDRDSPKTIVTSFGRSGPKTITSVRYSPKPVATAYDIDSPKTIVTACGADSSESVSAAHNIQFSADEGKMPNVLDVRIDDQLCDPECDNFLNQATVSGDPHDTGNHCDAKVTILKDHNIDGEIIPRDNCCVNSSHTDAIAEYIPMEENEHSVELVSSTAETKAENVVESRCSNDNSLKHYIPDADPGIILVERSQLTSVSDAKSQHVAKSEEFIENKFTSVDSTSASEEIIDFVTDLLASDDEGLGKKRQIKEGETQNGPQCAPEDDQIGEMHQSQTVCESSSSLKFRVQSQVSITSCKSTISSLSNVVRDSSEDSEQNEYESTIQATSHLSHSSSHIPSTANHPKSLSFGSITSVRKVSRYLKSPSPSYIPTGDIIPMMSLTAAQPRSCWRWLDATSCVIDDPLMVEWLSNTSKESETRKRIVKISKQLREDIMKKLQERNKWEVHRFKDIEQAVQRTTWVKKASMKMYLYDRKGRWIACNVELEQGISNLSEGSLTVHYQYKSKPKNTQITLSEMICVKSCSDSDNPSGFVVYTPVTNIIHQPLMLRASSENEAADWIGCLAAANAGIWNINCPIAPGAVWSCTFTGDIFVSPATSAPKNLSELCWGHHGGHVRMVETGPSGVTWTLGFDKMPYVYNNGYGGAISAGGSEMSDNTQQIMDHYRVFVYENQKWFPVIGWCCKGVFHNDFHWLTESGRSVETKEDVKLPSSKCHWISEWTVDFSTLGGVDTHGWQYSSRLSGPFYPRQHLRSSYRRRRWVRQYRITVFGPWQTAGSLGLVDLSVQVDPVASTSDPVVLWAVGANGDVLCRNGVTANNPKGQSWIHIATDLDKPFKSISVGGSYRVWGIAGDGSTWFRPGVSPYNQAGTCWLQVVPPPPGNFLLHQVSAGATSVWAVDTGDNLWRRENITPTFPEGTGWEFVASRVKRVSVGPRDQVWIIADASFSKVKHGAGVIYSRVGITSTKPSGTDWEVVIGSGWAHVSVRGVSEIKQEDSGLTVNEVKL